MLKSRFAKYFPIAQWLPAYTREDLPGDLSAGFIVAIVLIPQSMAYAMLAGLPPQIGLYSSVVPLLVYGIFGSSRALAVGPVGLVSLMTGTAIADLKLTDTDEIIAITLVLALLMGIFLVVLRIFRLSTITKFLSHPVMSGFTSAAAVLILMSQVKHLFGIEMPSTRSPSEFFSFFFEEISALNYFTTTLGFLSVFILVFLKNKLKPLAEKRDWGHEWAVNIISKSGPFVVVTVGILVSWFFSLHNSQGVDIIGQIPSGLPSIALPQLDTKLWVELMGIAALMAVIGFFESVSVAKAIATRKRQRIDANQESIALGLANIGSSFSGGMPVAGGFARSFVNFSAGANTPLANVFTALVVAIGLLFFTQILFFLPRSVLAAIIVVAVVALIDFHSIKEAWNYSKSDATAIVVTFFGVLFFGIESGILAGVIFSIGQYLHRSSTPHVVVVGRVGNTEHYRNMERHQVVTYDSILAVRIDESLYFANTNYLEEKIINLIADNPKVNDVVIICSAINFIDTSALHSLETIAHLLKTVNVKLHFASVKGPIMDRLLKADSLEKICTGRVYFSTHAAIQDLSKQNAQTKPSN